MKSNLPLIFVCAFTSIIQVQESASQSIGTFNSIEPTAQSQNFIIPGTHTFQKIIKSGNTLTSGGSLGNNLDFTGYVPIGGSSINGYLSISSETSPAECAILSINYNNANKIWSVTNSGKVDFPVADIGTSSTFCSGTVTPKNTILVCEEFATDGDVNSDGYTDLGWVIEIDPASRTVINQDGIGGVDKLWAMGRQAHENVAIKSDQTVSYWGADNATNGFLYKFVPSTPGNFSSGTLYVLQTTAALGTATWKPIANTTKDERNNTISLSNAAGGYNFQRIEDVEIGPDGKVYFASTTNGRIFRFTDAGSTVANLEVFVENTTYDVDGAGPFAPVKFEWPDNLAFDGDGNLWVLQDGGDNRIWVVSPSHTTATPAIKVFGSTPIGAESTGITFSPDYKFMFISIQHPDSGNTLGQTDAAGEYVIFNNSTTLVVSRKENLGVTTLPLLYIKMNLAAKNNGVEINWTAAGTSGHSFYEIERSTDGVNFTRIGKVAASFFSNASYSYLDNNAAEATSFYYRIKQCSSVTGCHYSEIKTIKLTGQKSLRVYPHYTNSILRVTYSASNTTDVLMIVYNNTGSEVHREKRKVTRGNNDFVMTIDNLPRGYYVLKVLEDASSESCSFVK
jgi:secreted PhoX family phosphatase